MTQQQILDLIDQWDPTGSDDLPDAVADALESDPVVAAAFEARFTRAPLQTITDPPPPARRRTEVAATSSRRRWPWALAAGLPLAAAAMIATTAVFSTREPLALPAPVDAVDADLQAEGPRRNRKPRDGRRNLPEAPAADPEMLEALKAVGYLGDEVDPPTPSRAAKKNEQILQSLGYVDAPAPKGTPVPFQITRRGRQVSTTTADKTVSILRGSDRTTVKADGKPVAEPPSSGEKHTSTPASGITLTEDDARSTFGLDVDTAAWARARASLSQGFRPPTASVRVEAFLNRLPYDYAPPKAGQPFAVHPELVPSPWHAGRHLLRIGVQSAKPVERKAVHLTFLVDTSGSMGTADKLPLVRQSLSKLVRQLKDGDTVALVVYAGSAGVVLPPTGVAQRSTILAALERLGAGGSTAMGQGIQVAYDLAEKAYTEGAVNRVIIASDGDANVGPTTHGPLAEAIRHYADKGITLTTVGVGTDAYNGSMMENLAQKGDGFYAWLDGPAEADRVFVEQLTQSMQLVARDAKAQVIFDPATVRSWRQVGYENRALAHADFRNDAVDAGEVGAGHQVTVLYEVELVPGATGPVGTVSLRGKPPGPDAPASEWTTPIPGTPVESLTQASADTRIAIAAAGLAEHLRDSPHARSQSAVQVFEAVAAAARDDVAEDVELLQMARRVRDLR